MALGRARRRPGWPELAQWLPSSALDEPIGTVGAVALRETASIVTALIS